MSRLSKPAVSGYGYGSGYGNGNGYGDGYGDGYGTASPNRLRRKEKPNGR